MSIEQENNDMLRNQIKEVAHHSSEIKKVVNKRTRVEPWVIAKTERAATDLSDVTHYLDGERFGDGGNVEIKKSGSIESGDTLIYELNVHQISPTFYHKLVGTIEKYDENEYWATYENELYEGELAERIFKTLKEAEKWVMDNINMDKGYYLENYGKMEHGGSMYAEGGAIDKEIFNSIEQKFGKHFNYQKISINKGNNKIEATLVSKFPKGFGDADNVSSSDALDNFLSELTESEKSKISISIDDENPISVDEVSYPFGNFDISILTNSNYAEGGTTHSEFNVNKVWDFIESKPFYNPNYMPKFQSAEQIWKSWGDEEKELYSKFKWQDNYFGDIHPREKANSQMRENYSKMENGGLLEKGAINYLGDLWFAVQESKIDEYSYLAENLDKLGVSFRIQNAVSSDAESMRGRRAISTEEAQQRIRKILAENGITKYAEGGSISSENAEKIAKLEKVLTSTLVPELVKEKARLEIERLKSESTSTKDSKGISFEQANINKKALELVDRNKITNFRALVNETLTDANYHTESFKFATIVDSSIKIKTDWYQADEFSGDDKTRKVGIEIANMCGWDGDKITEALYFVLKMKGQGTLADSVKKAMEVEEASYPNAIDELTKRQTEYTQEIATRTSLRQGAVADFVANNGLTETETLNIVQGLGMGKLKPADVMSAVLGTPHNEFEKNLVAFAKSGEAFKSEPIKARTGKVKLEEIEILWSEGNQSKFDKFPKKYNSWSSANEAVKPIAKDTEEYDGGYNKVAFVARWEDGEYYKGRLDVGAKLDNPFVDPFKGNVIGVHIKQWVDYILSDESGQTESEKKEAREWLEKYDLGLDAKVEEPKGEEPKVEEKEQPKVSDDRLKGKHISDVSKYVPHRNIESITFTIDGKKHTVKGSDIFDGIYVDNKVIGVKSKRKTKTKEPKVTRTQFEEEEFEYGKGGYTRPGFDVKVSGVYEFRTSQGLGYEISIVGFERQGDDTDSLYFDDSEKTAKKELGSITIKNNAWNKLSSGKTINAISNTKVKGKLTRLRGL